MRNHILPKLGFVVLAFLALSFLTVPGQVSAETIKVMVGTFQRLDREDILKSFARLPEGSCLVDMNGDAHSVSIINGYLTVEVPSPGQADLTIEGTATSSSYAFPGRSFRVMFDASGTFTAYDLSDPDSPNVPLPLGVGMDSDGSYHFEFLKDNIFVFSWADTEGPIMGRTYNWQHDNYESCPGTSRWNPTDEGIMRMFRSWSFNDVDGLIPGLEVTFIHPTGETTTRYYPGGDEMGETIWGVDQDGDHYSVCMPVDGLDGISGLVWKWRCDFNYAFTQRVMTYGTHAVKYTLISPSGARSNHRVEYFVVE